ncbi:hypothetical protein RB596_003693 [Gaeumannomyces avenae]
MALTPAVPPQKPGLAWRAGSTMIMGLTGLLSKGFLYGLNDVEVIGMDRFLDLLESRRDVDRRRRGLITVSNHTSVLDDPLIWGIIPLRYCFDAASLRWSLAAHDICFKNGLLTRFFQMGQTLPTYRFRHSPLGGPFQPTMTDAVRLLSDGRAPPAFLPYASATGPAAAAVAATFRPWAPPHAWVHVFPEGCVHQQAERGMRYFKWGVARLVLETPGLDDGGPSSSSSSSTSPPGSAAAAVAPNIVPMFIDGTDRIMAEDRGFPRFLPRVGRRVRVVFGEPLDAEVAFGDLRRRWRELVVAASCSPSSSSSSSSSPRPPRREGDGETAPALTVDLEHSEEARAIRIEVARRLRDEVLKLRRSLGYPDEDPKLALAETWARDAGAGYNRKSNVDDSTVSER